MCVAVRMVLGDLFEICIVHISLLFLSPQNASVVMSAVELNKLKLQTDQAKMQLAHTAQLRKQRMLQMEKEKSKTRVLTEAEELEAAKQRAILNNAKSMKLEESDDVKHMNQMTLYAKCVTIRDAQLLEKQRLKEAEELEDRRVDQEMEVERVRSIKITEERERQRAAEQRAGARVIIQQMSEREQERVRQQEIREQEAMIMIERIKEQEQKEEHDRQMKMLQNKKMLEEVVLANNEQAKTKIRKKNEEMEEDKRIAEYIRLKELKERQLEEELEAIRAAKEREIAKMRTQQEKGQDRQAQIDELRAKRYQEQKERQWRQEQAAFSQKREELKREIKDAREKQRMEKARLMAEQALHEREEFTRILDWTRQQAQIDTIVEQEHVEKRKMFREELMTQIHEKTLEKQNARIKFLQQGKNYKSDEAAEKAMLETIKEKKLKHLEKMGVPAKYRSELAAKEMLKSAIH